MMTKRKNQQIEMHLITIEDLVPMDHLLRKVNDIIDFSFIYGEVENLYCRNNGRPFIDQVVLIKQKGYKGVFESLSEEKQLELIVRKANFAKVAEIYL